MKNVKQLLAMLFIGFAFSLSAQTEADSTTINYEEIEKTFNYQTGTITLADGNAKLVIPKGFKYLDAAQTRMVLEQLWGNPEDTTILGSLIPANKLITNENAWLFTINYDPMGFVKDDDAKETDYDEMLTDLQKDFETENPERIKQGYPAIKLVGWASKPFYDEKLKVLHWAKELKFGEDEYSTLNYDLRVLGRKGVFIVSAVATMDQLAEVKASIPQIITSIQYDEGFKYADFDSNVDDVAAWTVGGLVAGKVLAKVGFFAVILKFWKLIAVGVVAAFAGVKKFFFNKKEQVVSNPDKKEDEIAASDDKTEV